MHDSMRDALRAEKPVALATVIAGTAPRCQAPRPARTADAERDRWAITDLDRVVRGATPRAQLQVGSHLHPPLRPRTARRTSTAVSVFIESFASPPAMMIFGAVDFTAALAQRRQAARLPRHRVWRRARGRSRRVQRFPMAGRGDEPLA